MVSRRIGVAGRNEVSDTASLVAAATMAQVQQRHSRTYANLVCTYFARVL
jgi:hypothetical protein